MLCDRGWLVRRQQIALPICEVHKIVAPEYQVDEPLNVAAADGPRAVRTIAQERGLSFWNRIGEFHFADAFQKAESAFEHRFAECDPRSESVEDDFATAVQPSGIINSVAAHRSREQLAHVIARHPGLQIRGIAKGLEIQLLDRFMQKNSDVAATGQVEAVGAPIARGDTGFESVWGCRLQRGLRLDGQDA